MKKVAIITGASSGMGKSTAHILHQQGYKVYGAARRTERMKDLEDKGMGVVSLDLTNDASIVKAVDTVLEKEGRIDVLINNAGYGSYGSVEEVTMQEAKRQFEVKTGLAGSGVFPKPLHNAHLFHGHCIDCGDSQNDDY